MTTIDWIIISAIAAIVLGLVIWKIVQFCKMTPEQKKEIIKDWLISAVVAAEGAITTSGAGAEKMQMVIDKFNKHAPILCKIILFTTKTANLNELIKEALETVKSNFGVND